MCGSPEGYGSISRTYDLSTSAAGSLGTSHVRSSAQTRCHLLSIVLGSYLPATNRTLSARFPSQESGTIASGMTESRPPISAADLAAGQVAAIVSSAEHAADEIVARAEREAREREREGERKAAKLRQDGEVAAAKVKEEAQAEAVRIAEI